MDTNELKEWMTEASADSRFRTFPGRDGRTFPLRARALAELLVVTGFGDYARYLANLGEWQTRRNPDSPFDGLYHPITLAMEIQIERIEQAVEIILHDNNWVSLVDLHVWNHQAPESMFSLRRPASVSDFMHVLTDTHVKFMTDKQYQGKVIGELMPMLTVSIIPELEAWARELPPGKHLRQDLYKLYQKELNGSLSNQAFYAAMRDVFNRRESNSSGNFYWRIK